MTRPCWWQRDSKNIPMTKICKNNITYIGIAKDEEKRTKRKNYKKDIYKFPLVKWGWTEQDCFNYLEKRGLKHPLQHKFKRTGCWLCPKQSKPSLITLYKDRLNINLKFRSNINGHHPKSDISLITYSNRSRTEGHRIQKSCRVNISTFEARLKWKMT